MFNLHGKAGGNILVFGEGKATKENMSIFCFI